jgi:Uma2 family endonuclease
LQGLIVIKMAGDVRFGSTEVTTMAAAIVPFVSVEEYLASDPEPDVDYVDGVLEERNLGEADHADLQGELTTIFRTRRGEWGIKTFPELRVQVAPTRYRIPDVCVMPKSWERTQIVREAPLLCLEVKSPSYTLKREMTRAQDYLRMGVAEVWIFDPESRKAYVLRGDEVTEQRDGVLKLAGTAIELDIATLFGVLDE